MIKPKHIANFGDTVVSLSVKDYDDLIAWGDWLESENKRLKPLRVSQKERAREAARKVLHEKGQSKAVKTKNGSAITQKVKR